LRGKSNDHPKAQQTIRKGPPAVFYFCACIIAQLNLKSVAATAAAVVAAATSVIVAAAAENQENQNDAAAAVVVTEEIHASTSFRLHYILLQKARCVTKAQRIFHRCAYF
jgi:hypothetical protein